jgi:hypothetical protein
MGELYIKRHYFSQISRILLSRVLNQIYGKVDQKCKILKKNSFIKIGRNWKAITWVEIKCNLFTYKYNFHKQPAKCEDRGIYLDCYNTADIDNKMSL